MKFIGLLKTQFIVDVLLQRKQVDSFEDYPYCIPAIAKLDKLELHPSVTFLIGENGSGKSTLLEAIAVAYGLNAEGGSKNFTFATKATHSGLHENILLSKGVKKPRDSYFLRAESFYNLATNIEVLGVGKTYGDRDLHAQSHGESFMSLFLNRFRGQGLYLLDEPEAALSPMRQLAFLSRLHQLVQTGSQLLIATHSPILLAYPAACIYSLDETGIHKTCYEQTEHFLISKSFLNNYPKLLRELMQEEE